MYVWPLECATAHRWRSEDIFWGPVMYVLPPCDFWGSISDHKACLQAPYPLICLLDPIYIFPCEHVVDLAQYTEYDYDEYHVCITTGSDSLFLPF